MQKLKRLNLLLLSNGLNHNNFPVVVIREFLIFKVVGTTGVQHAFLAQSFLFKSDSISPPLHVAGSTFVFLSVREGSFLQSGFHAAGLQGKIRTKVMI
jgi:hypothetical protein